jgi:hypothetical protein
VPLSLSLSLSLYIYIYIYIYIWLYSLLDLGRFFSLLVLYTVGSTPWTRDQPVARPLPTHDNTNTINAHRYLCLEWDSDLRSQWSSGRRRFMLQTTRPLRSVDVCLTVK